MTRFEDLQSGLENQNADALYEMKKLLRSKCSETQMSAVSVLESCLLSEPVTQGVCPLRELMLQEDMVGFLSDAMATNSWPLVERLASVLELLSDDDKMFLEGHAVVAAEAVQRRAHFLGLMVVGAPTECEVALQALLGILSTLLTRWGVVQGPGAGAGAVPAAVSVPVSALCPPQGVLATLRLVLAARSTAPATTLAAARTLCLLLRRVAVGRESGEPNALAAAIAACVRAALEALLLLAEGEDQGREDGDEARENVCAIAARVTSVRAACEALRDADHDGALLILEGVEAEAQQAMLQRCLPAVVKAASACIEDADEESAETWRAESEASEGGPSQPSVTWVLLDALECGLEHGKDPAALADALACQGFLWLLPTLYRTERSAAALRLLCSVLAHLAHDLADAAAWWPDGPASLAAFLVSAEPLLDEDNCAWPLALERWAYVPLAAPDADADADADPAPAGPTAAAHLLVLLLTYFRALAESACDEAECEVLRRGLPAYVLSLPAPASADQQPSSSSGPPPGILKLTWLCFTVHCVLDGKATEATRAASARLTALLDRLQTAAAPAGGLALAFTAHPTLLHWAFRAAGVAPRLQQRVLELWLGQHDEDEGAGGGAEATPWAALLLELVLSDPQAVHPLLDVVTSGDRRAAEAASRVLCQAAASDESVAEDLGAGVWGRLPLSLSRCGGTSRPGGGGAETTAAAGPGAEGCGLLVALAAEVYRPPPADMALRIAHLLGGILGRQRLGAAPRHVTAAMLILRWLLEDGRKRSDPRILTTLLGDGRFAEVVLAATTDDDAQVCAAALQLLLHLEEGSGLLKSPVIAAAITLDMLTVLATVSSPVLEVFQAGLKLLVEVLSPKPHPFLALEDNEEVLDSVFYALQNQALKFHKLPPVGGTVWRALRGLLPRAELLCVQPWNHVVIPFVVKQGPLAELNEDFLSFVLDWLTLVAPEDPPVPRPRRPMPTMLTETAIEIATAVVHAGEEAQKLPLVRDIARALLAATADLPASLEPRVKEIASSGEPGP